MSFGDLKVQDLIYEDSSNNEITVVIADLATKTSPAFSGTITGVNLTLSGDLQVNGTTTTINTTTLQVEDKNIEIGKVSSPSDNTADGGGWSLLGATTKTFNWVNATDAWTSSEHLHLLDDKKLLLGTSSECTFFHDNAGHTYLTTSTGNFHIQCPAGENSIRAIPDGAVELYYNNSKKFETSNTGVSFGDGWLYANDNAKIRLGNGADLQIYHDGNNSRIEDAGTGRLFISSDLTQFLNAAKTETTAEFIENGACQLYYDNSKKFETTSSGAKVTGTLEVTEDFVTTMASGYDFWIDRSGSKVLCGDNISFRCGNAGDLQIYHNGTDSYIINTTGNLVIKDDSQLILRAPITAIKSADNSEACAKFFENGAAELYYDDSKKFETTSAGVTVTGTVSDSKGDLRKIPINAKSSSYTLISSDAGKTIRTTAGVTVPSGVFYEGEAITIFNDSGSDITITQGSNQTMYNAADAATGNRTLAGRGLATVLCFDNNEFVISGAGLS